MTTLHAASERLSRPDLFQLLLLVLAVLATTLLVAWPPPGSPNESWYALTQVRAALLALLALGFGALPLPPGRPERRATALALVAVALLSSPLEVAAHAATQPATPLAWPLLLAPLDTLAFYGLGVGLGALLRVLRLGLLLPLAVPALLVGLAVLDTALGRTLANPVRAAARGSLPHAVLAGLVAVALTAWLAWPPARRPV